jgi:hypothetical protein
MTTSAQTQMENMEIEAPLTCSAETQLERGTLEESGISLCQNPMMASFRSAVGPDTLYLTRTPH